MVGRDQETERDASVRESAARLSHLGRIFLITCIGSVVNDILNHMSF